MSKKPKTPFLVTDSTGRIRPLNLTGRNAQCLKALIESRDRGITALDLGGAAVRISNYILALRRDHGIEIETITEKHGGEFAGNHGRFRLRSTVTLPRDVVAAT